VTPAIIDTHCHLSDGKFSDDIDEVIERAVAAGVTRMVAVGGGGPIEDSRRSAEMAERYDCLRSTAGIHPHDAASVDQATIDELQDLLARPTVVAVGETGLDYYYDNSPRDLQREALARHLQLAQQCSLPIVLHCRDAHEDLRDVLEAEGVPAAGGVVHCFTGNYQEACWYLDHGLLLSFTGIISFRNAGELRDVAARVPLDSMMLETDSPYLAPEPKRGKRNEPGYVVHVAEAMARARDCSLEEVARATTANAEKMFFS